MNWNELKKKDTVLYRLEYNQIGYFDFTGKKLAAMDFAKHPDLEKAEFEPSNVFSIIRKQPDGKTVSIYPVKAELK